ncbi:MAG: hypothetical protein IJL46_03950 [Clostridia bacterium]|nr:hypothetical protein [Clostridia bacterium]
MMFGYVTVNRPELKVRDLEKYRAYYCGLCRELGKYGISPRLLLNYDCNFVHLLLSSFSEGEETETRSPCVIHPFTRQTSVSTPWTSYAAAVNVLLGYESIKDKKEDGEMFLAEVPLLVWKKAYEKASSVNIWVTGVLRDELDRQRRLEKEETKDIDLAADPSGKIVRAVLDYQGQSQVLSELGYHLGRWIYLADAYEDREKDRKKGSYNIFNLLEGNEEDIRERASFNMKSSLRKLTLAYDLLNIKKNREILDNIIYEGLPGKTEQILKGKKKNESI